MTRKIRLLLAAVAAIGIALAPANAFAQRGGGGGGPGGGGGGPPRGGGGVRGAATSGRGGGDAGGPPVAGELAAPGLAQRPAAPFVPLLLPRHPTARSP